MQVVYFSSTSGNTKRFVDKLGLSSVRLPLRRNDPEVHVSEPYVLVVPTYGGGVHGGAVPKQVIRFLNDESNRKLIRGVVAMGNTNFGTAFCLAGKIISVKTGAPVIGQVEVFGTPEDVIRIREEIEKLGDTIEPR